jgi:alkanesulfonate monooxygenase SsuD/methylene tetrahydromethanopterin reductase-like flavin-dependent oxidoreductase (luciferase family)
MDIAVVIQGQAGVTWDGWQALASACEEYGVPTLYGSDHYQTSARARQGALETWGTICALAAVTNRLRLGTLVSPVTFRPPAVLSKLVSTADHVSGGRIDLGLGTGWLESEHTQYGLQFPQLSERIAMLENQLRTLHEHWAADWYAPAPTQCPHPPVIVGGSGGSRSLDLAARWADEYNTAHVLPDDAARRREALDHACQQAERKSIRFSVMLPMVVAESRAVLAKRERDIVNEFGRELGETTLRGTVGDVIGRLERYEAAGVDRVILGHLLHRDLETIALIGTEMLPAFQRRPRSG